MSLSSPEPALHHSVVGHVTEAFPLLPLRLHLKTGAECRLAAVAITVVFLCLLSMQYLFKETGQSDTLGPLWETFL